MEYFVLVVRATHVRSSVVHPNIWVKGYLMILAVFFNPFTFYNVITTIMLCNIYIMHISPRLNLPGEG